MQNAQNRNPGDLAATVSGLGLTVESTFIPLSQSRNAKEKYPTLNWRISLKHNGRTIIETDYSVGSAHCPSWRQHETNESHLKVAFECERGIKARGVRWGRDPEVYGGSSGDTIEPKSLDIIHSLVMDASAIDESGFEDWASSLGYDTDSRKAEAIYRQCLDIGLKLRNALGEAGLSALREAFQDY